MSSKTVLKVKLTMPLAIFSIGKVKLASGHYRLLPLALAGLVIGLSGFWATTATAQSFTVQNAKTELVDQVYRLDASLKYHFSPEALNALKNGITLILVLDIEVIKPRRYMWDEGIATLEQLYEIQYRALTDQYLLHAKNSGARFVYPTLNDALATLEKIDSLPIIDAHLLNIGDHYMVKVRSRLDFDSLPAPLRLKAYFSNDWWLTSGWYSWDLTSANK